MLKYELHQRLTKCKFIHFYVSFFCMKAIQKCMFGFFFSLSKTSILANWIKVNNLFKYLMESLSRKIKKKKKFWALLVRGP